MSRTPRCPSCDMDRPLGRRPLAPGEEAGGRDLQDATGPLDRATLIGELSQQGRALFWGHHRLPLLSGLVEHQYLLLELPGDLLHGLASSQQGQNAGSRLSRTGLWHGDLKAGDGNELMRKLLTTILQELVDTA